MNTVRKAAVVLLYLRRNGYSESANTLWLLIMMSRGTDRVRLLNWLNNNGSIEPLLNKVLFLNTGTEIINIRIGFKSLNKLLAVLPKRIDQ
jgi:hypothetical protein